MEYFKQGLHDWKATAHIILHNNLKGNSLEDWEPSLNCFIFFGVELLVFERLW